jgi:NAD(P)-dependent dehydrogenase (short-subunit alcohol dehydrogenase family)
MLHYGMTKTAQLGVSRGLAGLTKGTKVTVNSVLPGPTRSEGIIVFLKSLASGSRVLRQRQAVLAPTADDRAWGDRQPGRLRGEPALFGQQWRRASRRWWRHAHDRLRAERLHRVTVGIWNGPGVRFPPIRS